MHNNMSSSPPQLSSTPCAADINPAMTADRSEAILKVRGGMSQRKIQIIQFSGKSRTSNVLGKYGDQFETSEAEIFKHITLKS